MSTETQLTQSIASASPQTEIKEEKKEKQEIEIKSQEENEEDKPIRILLDKDQNESEKYDADWNYNLTFGNIAKYKVPSLKNQDEQAAYWFHIDGIDVLNDKPSENTTETKKKKKKVKIKPIRKVFVSGKIKRLSDIDADEQTFRCKFHLYMNWFLTKAEYLNYLEHKNNGSLSEFTPEWYPRMELKNCIQQDENGFEEYPNEGQFRVVILKGFGDNLSWGHDINMDQNVFCRAKLDVSGVFSEELELDNFPFDCQPLNIYIHERGINANCFFLPELRKSTFFAMDPRFSVYSEWSLESMKVTFGDAIPFDSAVERNLGMICMKIILKRQWKIYIYRSFLVIAVIDLLGLCGFVIFDATDRLNMLLALLLTIVVAMQESLNEPYMTFLGRYSLAGFIFLVLLTAQATFYDYYDTDMDVIFLICFSILFVIMQIIWCCLAYVARKDEMYRCFYSADEEEMVSSVNKPSLRADWTKWYREGDNNRLLSFVGLSSISHFMSDSDKEKVDKKNKMLEKMAR